MKYLFLIFVLLFIIGQAGMAGWFWFADGDWKRAALSVLYIIANVLVFLVK